MGSHSDLTILLVRYLEPYGEQIYDLVMEQNYQKVFVNRNPEGIGPLAECINRGIKKVKTEFCFIVTNATFSKETPIKLLNELKKDETLAAIHPCFNSDHAFLRPHAFKDVIEKHVPFLEFTCPMIRTKLLIENPLDESQGFWGHDLDWGYRVRNKGYNLAVHHGVEIKHVYIRDQKDKHLITQARWDARRSYDHSTRESLIKKYGANWRQVLSYK